ncbi:hypothetical protein [Agarivorans gilvus]|uniref:TIGR04255 family protein n=1 Tax=Agarivorans gilvus TaxID=680279 RepID=A0ABQ1I9A7_9ALTE|nr:hypothetical protein [Agarivorans gilvus]GGB21285.1 hypothetical protein GCM10007414_38340 [Agarivorans gilvus]
MKKPTINGEQPIENAPIIQLDNGACCIPQHYLSYSHSVSTIQQIISNCDFDDDYKIFAGQDLLGLYIQIGVVGFDTYQSPQSQKSRKILYGRRWRIEPYFPTSELIQTIYLAIKKAREHEVRESLKLNINGKYSAPFSSHQDLPLICDQFEHLASAEQEYSFAEFRRAVAKITKSIRFDHCSLRLINIEKRYKDQILIDVKFATSEWSELPEIHHAFLTIIINKPSINLFLHELMDAIIKHSDDYVAENFHYNHSPRFSKSASPLKLADLSQQVRRKQPQQEHCEFYQRLAQHNECVDKLRAPTPISSEFSEGIAKDRAIHG